MVIDFSFCILSALKTNNTASLAPRFFPLHGSYRRAEDRAGGEGEGDLPRCARSELSSEAIA